MGAFAFLWAPSIAATIEKEKKNYMAEENDSKLPCLAGKRELCVVFDFCFMPNWDMLKSKNDANMNAVNRLILRLELMPQPRK